MNSNCNYSLMRVKLNKLFHPLTRMIHKDWNSAKELLLRNLARGSQSGKIPKSPLFESPKSITIALSLSKSKNFFPTCSSASTLSNTAIPFFPSYPVFFLIRSKGLIAPTKRGGGRTPYGGSGGSNIDGIPRRYP